MSTGNLAHGFASTQFSQVHNFHCIEAVDQLLREHARRLQVAMQQTDARVYVCYADDDLAEYVA